MRTTAHHSHIASASVLRQASSALSAGNCSVAKADLEATGVAVDIVRRRTIALARTLPVPRHPMGRFRRRERFQVPLIPIITARSLCRFFHAVR
ncbi:hypothetical protein T08_13982 [Trichinella sp. T8]|nr:hypothetical protein T08_13982 [Trichinella sp. T8]